MRNKLPLVFIRICLVLLWSSLVTSGQTPQPASTRAPLIPIVPAIVEYDFAELYFSQWELDDPRYSRISAIVTLGDSPIYLVILVEQATGRQVYYSNSAAKISALNRSGKIAHKTPIDFRVAKAVGLPSTYGLGFCDAHGTAILWRFTPATRPSQRGAGLMPLSSVPGLRLDYSELGTTAGAGTAVQIGDRVSEAHAWPEISSPPYFVAFRGSHSEGRHLGALHTGTERWSVVASPNVSEASELREGMGWTLREANGREVTLRITARRGDEVTITETDESAASTSRLELRARVTQHGFALREIRQTIGTGTMRIAFTPELNLANPPLTEVNFEIDQGEHRRVTQGVVKIEHAGGSIRLSWTPRAPAWAKSQRLISTIRTDTGGYMIEVSTPAVQSSVQAK